MIKKIALSLILANQLFAVSDVTIMDLKETVYVLIEDVKRTEQALERNSLLVDVKTTDILKHLKSDTELNEKEQLKKDTQIDDLKSSNANDANKTRELISANNLDLNQAIEKLSEKIEKRVKELNEKIDTNQQNTLLFIKSIQKETDVKLQKITSLLEQNIISNSQLKNDIIATLTNVIDSNNITTIDAIDTNDTNITDTTDNEYKIVGGDLMDDDNSSEENLEPKYKIIEEHSYPAEDDSDNDNIEIIEIID